MTLMTTHILEYGESEIRYDLAFAERKTLGISVHPDLSVTVTAPEGSDFALVERKVRKKAPWILKQQRELSRYLPDFPPRQYVSGETHHYLGRQHRLKVIESPNRFEGVRWARGFIKVYVRDTADRERVKQLVDRWYRKQAQRVFNERLDMCLAKVAHLGITRPELALRVMPTRWGSCTASGRILLNPKLVQVPKSFIDYVLIHELCHLKEHNHGQAFFALLDMVMPDWRNRQQKLNDYQFS